MQHDHIASLPASFPASRTAAAGEPPVVGQLHRILLAERQRCA
ncbi:hypothetical protein SAZ_00480 [Streptomyces noursei ZPM]|nr:hypothetical protein SAZ_00480 [Streptomyces noursei ZPM]EPY92148.1 hypothetical protein K530_54845 [Streptomyces noursei CCRC 11814]